MLADPESWFLHDVTELLLLPAGPSQKCCHLLGHQKQQGDWWEVPCGGVELVALHLSGFQEIQQSLRDDQLGGGGYNEESFLVGQKSGQRRLVWVEF